MSVTLKETITQGKQSTKYGEWDPKNKSTGETLTPDDAEQPKQSKFSSFLNAAKNALLSGFIKNDPYATGVKYYGDGEAYTDGTQILDTGRFVATTEHLKRFRMGNEWGTASNNNVFIDGYEDPTFLTFKIEFGEWGATLCDDATIASVQSNSIYNNTQMMNYDVMPMGLLDLNFIDQNNLNNFNAQQTYNAYNYLLNRNEDRRADYIRDFVQGLYTVQRDFPYIFQKINGVNKLESFDSKSGQRLKDCVLKLTCMSDGLDMKMRTLLELYRKAAWDDEYQRWELPDIHRYFKMIIYVFDHRAIAMGNGEFSPDNEYLPIIAYECGPCEFVIDSWSQADYSVDYKELKQTEPTIDIKVHNVRTFYSNRMFQNVKYINDMWTKDMRSNGQLDSRATFTDGRPIAWQYIWLQRMFMQPDEWAMGATWNEPNMSTANTHYHADANDFEMMQQNAPLDTIDQQMDNTWHFATVSDHAYAIRSFKDLGNALKEIITQRTQLVRDSRTSNRYYFVNDMPRLWYYLEHAYFNMVEIDTEGAKLDIRQRIRHMIRHLEHYALELNVDKDSSLQDPGFEMNLDKQHNIEDIDFLDSEKPEQKLATIDTNTILPEQDLYEIIKNLAKSDMDLYPIKESDKLPEQELTELVLNLEKNEMELTPLELNLIKDLMKLFPLELNTEHSQMEMAWILLNLEHFKQTLTYLHKNEDKLIINMQEIIKNLLKPDMDMAYIIQSAKSIMGPLSRIYLNLSKSDMNMSELDFNLDKYKGPLSEIILNLEHMEQELTQLMIDLSKPHIDLYPLKLNLVKDVQELVELIQNLSKDEMNFYNIIKNLDIPEQELTNILKNVDIPEQNMTTLIPNLEKMIQNLAGIEKNLDLPQQELTEIIKNLDVLHQELTAVLVNTEKPEQELISVELNEAKPKVVMVPAEQNIEKPKQEMIMSEPQLSKVDMNQTPIVKNIDLPNVDLQPQYINQNKPEMTMIDQEHNLNEIKQDMTPIEQNIDKSNMSMTPQQQNLQRNEMYMPDIQKNTSNPDMNFVNIEQNTSRPEMEMTEQDINISREKMNMSEIDQKTSLGEMQMSELNTETSLGKMQMSEQYINTEKKEQTLTKLQTDNDTVKVLPMTRIEGSSYNPPKPTVVIDRNSKHSDMEMTQLNISEKGEFTIKDIELKTAESGDMKMTELETSDEIVHALMSELQINDEKKDMEMSELNINTEITHSPMAELKKTEHISNMEMQQLLDNEKTQYVIRDGEIKEDPEIIKSQKEAREKMLQQSPKIVDTNEKAKTMLMSRIEMLQQLDLNSLEGASLEQLIQLFQIIENTTDQVKKEMKMQEIQMSSKTGKTMTMTGIKQAERSQFLSKPILDPGREAYERAEAAYARAHPNQKKS